MKKGTVRLGAAPREYHCFVCTLVLYSYKELPRIPIRTPLGLL